MDMAMTGHDFQQSSRDAKLRSKLSAVGFEI